MMNRYLIQAPTVIVIGVAGAATWPALFPEGGPAPTKGTSKPPPMEIYSPSAVEFSGRDPFFVGGPPDSSAARTPSPKGPASKETVEAKVEKPASPGPASPDSQVVAGMKLGGIYIGGSDPVAIIDDQVYAPGERLRKADGSPLPYVVARILKDRAVLRNGREQFTLGFSDDPGAAAPRAAPAIAAAPPPANPGPTPMLGAVAAAPGPRANGGTSRGGGDMASMLLRLLSGLGGSSGGGGGGSGGVDLGMLGGLLGGGSGAGLGSAGNTPVTPSTIQTGLDAIMGKFDNVGQGGPIPGQSGGSNP